MKQPHASNGAYPSSRAFGGGGDLALARDFLSRAASNSPPQYYAHPGDVLWLLHRDPTYDPALRVACEMLAA